MTRLEFNQYHLDLDCFSDIPNEIKMEGWKQTPIKESFQPLTLLNGLNERILTQPMYNMSGITDASEFMYLRSEATERLAGVTRFLPTNYSFVVFDAHRPISVQAEIFTKQRQIFKNLYPNLDEAAITRMTEVYVSFPSTDPKKPSPHSTGGAIDLSICNDNGDLLEMGTECPPKLPLKFASFQYWLFGPVK